MSNAFATRHADYGQRWGEGAARCFSIEGDFLDDGLGLRLMPVPESFFCPISAAIMNDPVATVDGCSYEREYIERWFRERRQFRQSITSPTTGLELQSTTLMPLMALQRAIEAYLLHRPELKRDHLAGRSFEEAAQVLQIDLLEKQASNATVVDELYRLREANRALKRALRETEAACKKVMKELELTRARVRQLEDPTSEAMQEDAPLSSATTSSAPDPSPINTDRPPQPPPVSKTVSWGLQEDKGTTPSPSPTSGGKSHQKVTKAENERRRVGRGGAATDVKAEVNKPEGKVVEPRGKVLDNLNVRHSPRQFWQGALLVFLLALCLFIHIRYPAGLKVPMEKGGLEHGRGDASISRQVQQLQSSIAVERMIAALTLQKIAAESQEHQAAVIDAGVADHLVKLLEDDGANVQEASATTLATLAASSSRSQGAIVRAGAISPLVQLLKASDVDVAPKAAAVALRRLAAGSEKNQVAIAKAGAIAPLVEIMRSNSPGARLEAAAALRELAGEGLEDNRYGKQVAIAQAGAIVPLVRMIVDEAPAARQAAAGTLRMLATNNADNQVAIAQAGAIGPLVALLSDLEPGARQEAAAALDRLTVLDMDRNFGNQVAIGQAGAITELAKLLQDDVSDVALAAASALRSLAAGNADNMAAVIQAGVSSDLLKGESP